MKKNLIALAAFVVSGASFAQSSVSLYGIADAWVGRTTATGAASQIKLDSGGVSGSRFGFKGTEDLGGGLKANFLLEQGFNLDTGTQSAAGQMFARQSYVGFAGNWGEVKVGRMWTAFDDISGAANAAFDSALSPQNSVWLSTGYQANPNNSVYFASPNIMGFSYAASYSFGENKTAAAKAGLVTSFNIKYESGPLYAGLAYQVENKDSTFATVKFTRVNGTYDLGVAKVLVGFGSKVVNDSRTNEWELGADFPVSSALTVSGGVARSSDNLAAGDAVRKGYGLAASYSLSKRTSVYTGYQSSTKTVAGTDTDATLLAVGMRHAF